MEIETPTRGGKFLIDFGKNVGLPLGNNFLIPGPSYNAACHFFWFFNFLSQYFSFDILFPLSVSYY